MIFLRLFWVFFKIGLFTIGGGHAMIPLIMQDVVNEGWMSEQILLDFIAISESTPGPFAVNIATYTGMEVGRAFGGAGYGFLGAILSTLGVVLPSVIIIILIAKLLYKYMKKPAVEEVFTGVRSSVSGLILSVFVTLTLTVLFGIGNIYDVQSVSVDFVGIAMFAVLMVFSSIRFKGKTASPILIVLISAILGLLLFGVAGL